MASVVNFRFTGDKYKAQGLHRLGLGQLEILKRQMDLGGLKTYERKVGYADGTVIHCTSAYGLHTVNIYVPPGGGLPPPREIIRDPDIFIAYSPSEIEQPRAYDINLPAPYMLDDWKKETPYMFSSPENFDESTGIISALKSYTYNTALSEGKGLHSISIHHKKSVSVPDVFGEARSITQLERIQVYHDCPDEGLLVDIQTYAANFWVYDDGRFAVVTLDIVTRVDGEVTYWCYQATLRKYGIKGELESTTVLDSNEAALAWNYRAPRWGVTVAYDGSEENEVDEIGLIYTNAWDGDATTAPEGNIKWNDGHVVQDGMRLFDYDPVSRCMRQMSSQKRRRAIASWMVDFAEGETLNYMGMENAYHKYSNGMSAHGDAINLTDGTEILSNYYVNLAFHAIWNLQEGNHYYIYQYASKAYWSDIPELTIGQCWSIYKDVNITGLIPALLSFYDYVSGNWEWYDVYISYGYDQPYQWPLDDVIKYAVANRLARQIYVYGREGRLVLNAQQVTKTFKWFPDYEHDPYDPNFAEAHYDTFLVDWAGYSDISAGNGDLPPPMNTRTYGIEKETYISGSVIANIPNFEISTSIGAYRMLHVDPAKDLFREIQMFKQIYSNIPSENENEEPTINMQAYKKLGASGEVLPYGIPRDPRRWTSNGAVLNAHHYEKVRLP